MAVNLELNRGQDWTWRMVDVNKKSQEEDGCKGQKIKVA